MFSHRKNALNGAVSMPRGMKMLPFASIMIGLLWVGQLLAQTPQSEGAKAIKDLSDFEIDERLQLHAIASRTLTWLTGTSEQNDYISVGRLANFFGFVKFRVASGHSLSRSAVGQETLALLSDSQRAEIFGLLDAQRAPHAKTIQARQAMNRALEGLLVGEPVSKQEFLDLGAVYGAAEAELGGVIAATLGRLNASLSAEQQAALRDVRARHISGQGKASKRRGDNPTRGMSREDKQELLNLASRFLTWVTGTPEDNDFETVGKPSQHFGFVNLRIQSNHGVRRGDVAQNVMEILSTDQNTILKTVVAKETATFREFLNVRSQLMRSLEVGLGGNGIDQKLISARGANVGRIEALMTWEQAQGMLRVRRSMSESQSSQLLALRQSYVVAVPAPNAEVNLAERGRLLFAQCALCHAGPAGQTPGPSLEGVVGRAIAGDGGYRHYSPAMTAFAAKEEAWTPALLEAFLASPKGLVGATTMGFDGFESSVDRSAIVAYLRQRSVGR